MSLIRFLPSYVGSKAHWVDKLQYLQGENFVELFAGSGVLSANLAKTAILNDKDPYIFNIYNNYNDLIVPEEFTQDDYFKYRKDPEWWKYIYPLLGMSFSGVYRYSKNGFNVPVKKVVRSVKLKNAYDEAKKRFNELKPVITNYDYLDFPRDLLKDKIVILDPPYAGAQAFYNTKHDSENKQKYWNFVNEVETLAKRLIIFDAIENMPFKNYQVRKMRVNGKYGGGKECMYDNKTEFNFESQKKIGDKGEELFLKQYGHIVERTDGYKGDFRIKETGEILELKTDTYLTSETPNFFMEAYSIIESETPGGPWQAQNHGCKFFVYFFMNSGEAFLFTVSELVSFLDGYISRTNPHMKEVPNDGWNSKYNTGGYALNRNLFKHIFTPLHDYKPRSKQSGFFTKEELGI